MATTFHFVRHGSTAANEQGLVLGKWDVPLSSAGIEQALKLRGVIRRTDFDVVYCSPLLRAYHTALISLDWAELSVGDDDSYLLTLRPAGEVQQHTRLLVDMRLAERSGGDLHGEPKRGYADRFPKYAGRNVTMSFSDKADGGENFADLESQIAEFIGEVSARHSGKTLLVYSHNGPIRIAAKLFLGLSEDETLKCSNPHCELITFRG